MYVYVCTYISLALAPFRNAGSQAATTTNYHYYYWMLKHHPAHRHIPLVGNLGDFHFSYNNFRGKMAVDPAGWHTEYPPWLPLSRGLRDPSSMLCARVCVCVFFLLVIYFFYFCSSLHGFLVLLLTRSVSRSRQCTLSLG